MKVIQDGAVQPSNNFVLALAAGVTDKLWKVSDIVAILERWELANYRPESWAGNTQSARVIPSAFCGAAEKSIRFSDLKRGRCAAMDQGEVAGWLRQSR
jgi:hypothetical protein